MKPVLLSGDRNCCPTCGEHFNSSSAFDAHRTGRIGVHRRCRSTAEMAALGFSLNAAGFWITKSRPEGLTWRISAAFSGPVGGDSLPAEKTPDSGALLERADT